MQRQRHLPTLYAGMSSGPPGPNAAAGSVHDGLTFFCSWCGPRPVRWAAPARCAPEKEDSGKCLSALISLGNHTVPPSPTCPIRTRSPTHHIFGVFLPPLFAAGVTGRWKGSWWRPTRRGFPALSARLPCPVAFVCGTISVGCAVSQDATCCDIKAACAKSQLFIQQTLSVVRSSNEPLSHELRWEWPSERLLLQVRVWARLHRTALPGYQPCKHTHTTVLKRNSAAWTHMWCLADFTVL